MANLYFIPAPVVAFGARGVAMQSTRLAIEVALPHFDFYGLSFGLHSWQYAKAKTWRRAAKNANNRSSHCACHVKRCTVIAHHQG